MAAKKKFGDESVPPPSTSLALPMSKGGAYEDPIFRDAFTTAVGKLALIVVDRPNVDDFNLHELASRVALDNGTPHVHFEGRVALAGESGRALGLLVRRGSGRVGLGLAIQYIVYDALPATLDALAEFADPTQYEGSKTNLLTLIGNAVSKSARRAVLLACLNDVRWNLTVAATILGLDSSGTVLRSIREHGLVAEYEQAKREGKARGRGGARPGAGRPKKSK